MPKTFSFDEAVEPARSTFSFEEAATSEVEPPRTDLPNAPTSIATQGPPQLMQLPPLTDKDLAREDLRIQMESVPDEPTLEKLGQRANASRFDARAGLKRTIAGLLRSVGAPPMLTAIWAESAAVDAKDAKELAEEIGGGKAGDVVQELSSTAIQSLPALVAAPAGLPAMAAAAGIQTAGSVSDEAYNAYRASGVDVDTARAKSRSVGALAGSVTAALTRYIPGGTERLAQQLAKGEMKEAAARGIIRTAIKEGAAEFPEEALDQFSQGVIARLSYDPNRSWNDIVTESFKAGSYGAVLGGTLGGGVATVGKLTGTGKSRLAPLKKDRPKDRPAPPPVEDVEQAPAPPVTDVAATGQTTGQSITAVPAPVAPDPIDVFIQSVLSGETKTTQAAMDFGKTVTTADGIAKLRAAYEKSKSEGLAILSSLPEAATDAQMQAAINQATAPQFLNEAIEAATGAADIKASNVEEYNARMAAGVPAAEFKPATPKKKAPQWALDELASRGWNLNWPFVPADLQNQSFVQAIESDPSLSKEERNLILSFAPGGENYIGLSPAKEKGGEQNAKKKAKEEKPPDVLSESISGGTVPSSSERASELEILETLEESGDLNAKQRKRLAELRTLEISQPSSESTITAVEGREVMGKDAAGAAVTTTAAPASPGTKPKRSASKSKGSETKTADPATELPPRVLDTQQGETFGPSFEEPGDVPDDNKQAAAWLERATRGARPTGEEGGDKTVTRRTIVVRDNDTGELVELGIYNNPNPTVVPLKGKKGVDALKFLRTYSKKDGVLLRYTPVAFLRYSDARKGAVRPITQDQLVELKTQWSSMIGDTANTGVAVTQVRPDDTVLETVVDTSATTGQPDALNELRSWLTGKLVDKKTGKLKPITPDMALDLADEFSSQEPETAKAIAIEIGTPLAKDEAFVKLKKAEQLNRLRSLFASRIYEVVRIAYTEQNPNPALGPGAQPSTDGTAPGAGETIDVEAAATPAAQPTGADETKPESSVADRAVEALEGLKIKTDKLFLMPDLGITATLWNGALTAAQASIRAGQAIGAAIDASIEWLRTQTQTFNEDAVRARLNEELAPLARESFSAAASSEQDPPQPDERWVPTQVQGQTVYVRDRDRLTPESTQAAMDLALRVLTEAGFPVELRTFTDPADRQTKSIFFIGKTSDVNRKGRALARAMEREIATQRNQGRGAADLVAMLINSVRENFARTDSAFGDMDSSVRNRLFAIAQEEASFRGRALRALKNFRFDVVRVAQNVDVMLSKIYSDAFNGPAVRGVLRRITDGVRQRFTDSEVADIAARLGDPARAQVFADALRRALAQEFASADEVVNNTRAEMVNGGASPEVANEVVSEAERIIRERLKQVGIEAAKDVAGGLSAVERRTLAGKKWKAVSQLVQSGMFDDAEALRKLAQLSGWKVPTLAEIAEMRRLALEEQRLTELTPAQRTAAGTDLAKLSQMQAEIEAVTRERRDKLKKRMATMWSEMTLPTNFRYWTGEAWQSDVRANNARFINELISANLLFRASFATKQLIDIGTQWFWRMPLRAFGQALELRYDDMMRGNPTTFWKDANKMLSNMYRDNIKAMRAAAVKARAAWAGRVEVRNVDRIMSSISALDRLWARADSYAEQGNPGMAFLLRAVAVTGFSYRYAGSLDFLHGLPAEWNHKRFLAVQMLRNNGVDRAAAEVKADEIMGDINAEITEAMATAASILQARGIDATPTELRENAMNLIEGRQTQRLNQAGLPADAINEEAALYRNTLGWNEREVRGVGGLVGYVVGGAGRILESKGIPSALGRFGNAIAIGINRQLHRTLLYALADAQFVPGERKSSPWFRTRTDLYERRVEAAAASVLGGIFLGLAWAGLAKVWVTAPKDKEERELWEREGHKIGTVEFDLGDGKFSVWSLTAGPMALFAPYLAAGGALNDLSLKQEEAQKKLEEEALRLGIPAGKAPEPSLWDYMGVAGKAAQGTLLGNRTASGLFYSVTDYGTWNVKKFLASQFSPMVPHLPAMQEFSRMSGVVMDPKKADLWDFIVPLPTSPARRVNILGDPVGTESDVQRVFQVLTGGSYPVIDTNVPKEEAAYGALFVSGYRPPSIDPNKGYAIGGEYRAMNEQELARYTQARGRYLKEELAALGPLATEESAKAAYQQANARALTEVGAVSQQPTRAQSTQAPVQRLAYTPALPATPSTSLFAPLRSSSRLASRRRRVRGGTRGVRRSRIRGARFRKPRRRSVFR